MFYIKEPDNRAKNHYLIGGFFYCSSKVEELSLQPYKKGKQK